MHIVTTVESLRDCLAATAPVDLLGIRLLKACPQPGLYPLVSGTETYLPRETLKEAVSEIVDYTGRCAAAVEADNLLKDLANQPSSLKPVHDRGFPTGNHSGHLRGIGDNPLPQA